MEKKSSTYDEHCHLWYRGRFCENGVSASSRQDPKKYMTKLTHSKGVKRSL